MSNVVHYRENVSDSDVICEAWGVDEGVSHVRRHVNCPGCLTIMGRKGLPMVSRSICSDFIRQAFAADFPGNGSNLALTYNRVGELEHMEITVGEHPAATPDPQPAPPDWPPAFALSEAEAEALGSLRPMSLADCEQRLADSAISSTHELWLKIRTVCIALTRATRLTSGRRS